MIDFYMTTIMMTQMEEILGNLLSLWGMYIQCDVNGIQHILQRHPKTSSVY